MLLNIYFIFFKYLWVLVDIKKLCRYPHNGYLHGYGADIYPADRVQGI